MMSKAAALELAREIPFPAPGEIVKAASVEVLCAFMELHSLTIREWRGGYVVLVHEAVVDDKQMKESFS
jgi:hypothetical protein